MLTTVVSPPKMTDCTSGHSPEVLSLLRSYCDTIVIAFPSD